MATLTGIQRKRAKHLFHDNKVRPLYHHNRLMRWAFRRWSSSAVFKQNYSKYFGIGALQYGMQLEVMRLHFKVWAWEWEAWACDLAFPEVTKESGESNA